jgi:hypothetical protein
LQEDVKHVGNIPTLLGIEERAIMISPSGARRNSRGASAANRSSAAKMIPGTQ